MADWPLTFRCNNNCISCISNTDVVSSIADPSMEQIKTFIGRLDPGKDYLGLSGGEPTLRKEFFEILRYARETKPSMYIFLVSNGRMFSYKKFTRRLASLKMGNFMVGIALYGHTADLHDSITRAAGSFSQTCDGIRNLLEAGIAVEVRIVINRLNYKSLPDMARFVSEEFRGIERLVMLNMKITGNAYKNREEVLVHIRDVVPYAQKATEILLKNGINTRLYHFPLCTLPESLRGIASGVTKAEEHELSFFKFCEKCRLKEDCPRIWKSYACIVGDDEFKPVE